MIELFFGRRKRGRRSVVNPASSDSEEADEFEEYEEEEEEEEEEDDENEADSPCSKRSVSSDAGMRQISADHAADLRHIYAAHASQRSVQQDVASDLELKGSQAMFPSGGIASASKWHRPAVSERLVLRSEEREASGKNGLGRLPHQCTDVGCLFLFAFCLAALGLIVSYASEHGDIRRLYHGLSFHGKLCGIDVPESYLYWCQGIDGTGLLDLAHPTCVASCPKGDDTVSRCYNATMGQMLLVKDYPTYVFAGRLCMPKDSWLTDQVSRTPLTHDLLQVSQILRAWKPLVISGVLAFVLGYAYLFFLNFAVGHLMWASMVVLTVLPISGGIYLLSAAADHGIDGIKGSGDGHWDAIVGLSAVVLGICFLLIACCRRRSIDMAIGCIEAACECIVDLPSVLLEPLITLFFKCIFLVTMLFGFFWLLSCGTLKDHGMYRSLEYSDKEKVYIVYYVFMMIWVNELCSAMSHFVLAFITQRWYFTPYQRGCIGREKADLPVFAILQAYRIGLCFHLGSLAFGAVVIAFVRVLRMALAYVAKNADESGNCIAACLAKAAFCCLTCCEGCLQFLNKNAYMDIALYSSNFCIAAQRANALIAGEITAVGALTGACWIFQCGGVGAITGLGALFTFLMVRHTDIYNQPTSEQYVQDPVLMVVVAAVISFLIALVFVISFETISSTILYCFAIEKQQVRVFTGQVPERGYSVSTKNTAGKPATRSLLRLLQHDLEEDDDSPTKRECTPSTLQHLLQEQRSEFGDPVV